MPCPDFDVSIVKRSDGRSAVAAAAYQSGSRLYSEYDLKWKNYTGKKEVMHEEILLPFNAPPEYVDRQTLWNAVEEIEKNWNSQLARKIRMALPIEVPDSQYVEMVRQYCQEQFVSKGMICDLAIHDKGDGNPHVHIQLTMRSINENGKWNPKAHKVYVLDENGERISLASGNWKIVKKDVVDWNDQKYCEIWRSTWADIQNKYLEKNGRSERVDLRSYERQGLDQIPMVHMGPAAAALETKGVKTNIGNLNRDIQKINRALVQVRKMIKSLTEWVNRLSEKRKEIIELLKDEQEPTLTDLLRDYMEVRREERSTWSSRAQLNGEVADFNKIQPVVKYLEKNNLTTVDDLKEKIADMASVASPLRSKIRTNEKRIRRIDMTLDRYATFCRLKPVYEDYSQKRFKRAREKFYAAHKKELDQYFSAYRFLMKNGAQKSGNQLQFSPEEIKKERLRCVYENKKAQEDLDAMSGEIKTLNQVRYYISKVMPEPEQIAEIMQKQKSEPEKHKSIRERLKENHRMVAGREPVQKQKNQNIE